MKCVILVVLLAAAVQASPLASSPVHRIATLPPIPGAPTHPSSRIVNGHQATRGQFPYQAAIIIDFGTYCGGSLIHPQWILTAAHFVVDGRYFEVTLGQQQKSANEPGRVSRVSTDATSHEHYDPLLIKNDVALIKMPVPFELSQWIQVVALPRRSDIDNAFNGVAVTASGWGTVSDDTAANSAQLNYVNLHVISNEECAETYGSLLINAGILCCGAPGGISTCTGDSGGPLVASQDNKPVQVGVTSFVSKAGCEKGHPSGYTRVTSHLDWIENIISTSLLP